MTNKEYIQNCSEDELVEELVAFINEIDFCTLCDEIFWDSADCFENCPTAEYIISKWLKVERIAENDTQENNL